ncbi:vitamin K epoxide reductase family protein [Candidatus Gottesmanbacteria bacterium]|nr:vitamin K epoxide reductase family protein [Candidatus Gottesmanbacteria bacterium]
MRSNRVIFFLSILGIAIAIYVLQGFLRQTPIVCVNTGCETVRKSAASYLFGIPVPAFGLVGYTLLAILSFLRTTSKQSEKKLLPWILGIATGGVAFVAWFTYTEIFVIKAICTWCAISAVNMVIIFMISYKSYKNP